MRSVAMQSIETLDERAAVQRHRLWPPVESPAEVSKASEKAAAQHDSPEAQAVPEIDPWELLPAAQRLAEAVQYLRDSYCYCIFCGCKFDDLEDMDANCPGIEESDH